MSNYLFDEFIKFQNLSGKTSNGFCDNERNIETQECIPLGCVLPAHWPYLVVSAGGRHACHTQPLPHMPPCHTCPLPHMPPATHDPLPCMTPPLWTEFLTHAAMHATVTHPPIPCTAPAMHAPLPCMPPTMHATPAMHTELPRTPPLWTEFLTHACENITLPQRRAVKMVKAINFLLTIHM